MFRPRSSDLSAMLNSRATARFTGPLLCCMAALLTLLTGRPAMGQTGEWVWRGGSSIVPLPATCQSNATYIAGGGCGQPGVYGQQGTPSPANIPGGRDASIYWTGADGKFWLYGGGGIDAAGNWALLDDLWKFDPVQDEWTWITGSKTAGCQPIETSLFCSQPIVSGSQGLPAAGNTPGGRAYAANWIDPSGNLWLYGGEGTEDPTFGDLYGDLWKFDPGIDEWAWVNGSTTAGTLPVYGSLGVASATNSPGSRGEAASWTDASGKLWLFGGTTQNALGTDDLWKFDPATGEWTWMGGSENQSTCGSPSGICGEPGVYGQLGVAAASNIPGSRSGAAAWADDQGNFWLFGGWGFDSAGTFGLLNDLWEYTPATNEWTWVGGSKTIPACSQLQDCGEPGSYGNMGIANPGNFPGSRLAAAGAVDNSGQNYWLFGGDGYSSRGPCCGVLNDLWEYSPISDEWTWEGGSSSSYQPISYGVLGTPSASNLPSGRESAAAWVDNNGNFWFFGGSGLDSQETIGWMNDVWEFMPHPATAVPTPTLTPAPGTYTSPQTVTITDTAPGAAIHYTTDGTTPTAGSPVYSTPLTISVNETIEAIAVSPSGSSSPVGGGAYTILLPAASPTFNPPAGTYTSPQSVTISDATPGAAIYYAMNATPTTNSTLYTGPITVSSSGTIEALAVASGTTNSAVTSAAYTINLKRPGFALNGVPGTVTLSATGGASTFPLTITPQNGFNGMVSFACAGLPAKTTCTFNPSTVAPTRGPVSTQLTLTTNAELAAAERRGSSGSLPGLALAALFGLFGWKWRRNLRLLVVLSAAVAGLGLISGCSGSFLGRLQPGTSTVTITAVSGVLEQSATISLTVK